MSQTDVVSTITGATKVKASRAILQDGHDALRTKFSGTSFPSSPTDGMWCHRTDQRKLYFYDGVNAQWRVAFSDTDAIDMGVVQRIPDASAPSMGGDLKMGTFKITGLGNGSASTDAINKGQVDADPKAISIYVPGWAAALNRPLWRAPKAITVVTAHVLSDTAHTGSGGNSWAINVRNVGTNGSGTNDLKATPINTQTTPLVAYDALTLSLDQNLAVAVDECLQLRVTQNGTGGGSLASAVIQIILTYTQAL